MEEDDEEHGRPHQFTAEATDVCQFYIFYLYHVKTFMCIGYPIYVRRLSYVRASGIARTCVSYPSLRFRSRYFLHQLGEEPSETDTRYDVEQQPCVDITATALMDEDFPRDGMTDEEGSRDAPHPRQRLVYPREPMHILKKFCHEYAQQADKERQESPAYHTAAETVYEREAEDASEEVGNGGMERHKNLVAVAGVEDAEAKGQHAAHKIVAVTVHRLALRIVKAQDELDTDADSHQCYRPAPVPSVEQESIDDV